jgi:hypothetical protein
MKNKISMTPNNKNKDSTVMNVIELSDDIYVKLDHFFLVIKEKDGKKSLKPPENWTTSKKENPLKNNFGFNNGIGLIMGQKIDDDKFIIGVDFDNKDSLDDNGNIIIENGMSVRKRLYKQHKNKPDTLMQKTPTGGLHEMYYVDEKTKNEICGHNKISIDNKKVHIDIKFEGGFLLCSPSYYHIGEEKYQYKWKNKDLDNIKELPDFWIDILKNQQEQKIKPQKENKDNNQNSNIQNIIINQITDECKNILNLCLSLITTKDIKENTKKWLQIGRIIKNEGGSVDMWNEWSKGAYNYDINCCRERWKYFDTHPNPNMKINQLLYYYVKQESPDRFEEIKKMIYDNDIWKNRFLEYKKNKTSISSIYDDGEKYKEVEIKTKFLLDKEQDITKFINEPKKDTEIFGNNVYNFITNENLKVMGIKSRYGSGKTKLLTKIINAKKIIRSCFLSCRRALTYDIEREFEDLQFKNYLDKETANYMCDKFIVQYESIHKIFSAYEQYYEDEYTIDKVYYDFLILDELETILNHTISPTHNDNNFINFKKLFTLCLNSPKVICLDGDLSSRGKYFINAISDNYVIVNNTDTVEKNHIVYECYEKFVDLIMNDLKNNKKIFFSCMTKKYAEDYEKKIKEQYPNLKTKIIHGDMDDVEKQKILKNVNGEFIKYDVLFITPAVDVGVNFDPKDKDGNSIIHFDKVYGILGQSTCPRAFLQQLARVRNPSDSENYYILNSEFRYNEAPDFFTFQEIKKDIELWFKHNEYYRTDPIYKHYMNICIYNEVEKKNKHPYYFMAYLELMIKEKGGKFTYIRVNKENGEKKKELTEGTKIYDILKSDVDFTKDELLNIIDSGKAEERHKRAYNKLRMQTNVCYFNENEINEINGELKKMTKDDIKNLMKKKKKKQDKDDKDDKDKNDKDEDKENEENEEYNEKLDITKKFIYQTRECINMNKPDNLLYLVDRKNFLNKYDAKNNVFKKKNIETSNNIEKNIEIKAIGELYQKIGIINPTKEYELEKFDECIKNCKNIDFFTNALLKDTKGDIFDKKGKGGKTTLKPILGYINTKINKYSGYIKMIPDKKKINRKTVWINKYYYIPNKISIDILKQRLRTNKYKVSDGNQFLDHLKPTELNNFDIEYLGVDYDNIFDIFNIEQ